MGKAPAFQFYVADWLQDTGHLTLAAKGAWIDLLCRMWRSQTRGSITHDWQGYARLLGATVDQAKAVIGELTASNDSNDPVCNSVTHGDGKVTLTCRRMAREAREAQNHAARQHRYRERQRDARADDGGDGENDGGVTPPSSSSSSSSKKSDGGEEPRIPPELDAPQFRNAWAEYVAYRKSARLKTLLPASVERQFQAFVKWGGWRVAVDQIENTIRQGYQGIFPPGNGNGNGKHAQTAPVSKPPKSELIDY